MTIFEALRENDIKRVLELIESNKVDLNATETEEGGVTPLILAVMLGYDEVVLALLKVGANVNAMDTWGGMPISIVFETLYNPSLYTSLHNQNSPIPYSKIENIICALLSHKDIKESLDRLLKDEDPLSRQYYEQALQYMMKFYVSAFNIKHMCDCDYPSSIYWDHNRQSISKCPLAISILKNDQEAFKYFMESGFFDPSRTFKLYLQELFKLQALLKDLSEQNSIDFKAFEDERISYLEMACFLGRNEFAISLLKTLNPDKEMQEAIMKITVATKNDFLVQAFRNAGLKPQERPSQDKVQKIYRDLYTKIAAQYEMAKKANKKFILLLGEDHVSGEAFYLKNIILEICYTLGIDHHLTELDDQRLYKMQNGKEQQLQFDSWTMTHSWKLTLKNALHKGIRVMPIDFVPLSSSNQFFLTHNMTGTTEFKENGEARDIAMAKMACSIKEHCSAIVGRAHLFGILKNLQSYCDLFVIAFDISHANLKKERIDGDFMLETLKLSGNFLGFSMNDARTALQQIENAQILHGTEQMSSKWYCPAFQQSKHPKSCIQWASDFVFKMALKQNMDYFGKTFWNPKPNKKSKSLH